MNSGNDQSSKTQFHFTLCISSLFLLAGVHADVVAAPTEAGSQKFASVVYELLAPAWVELCIFGFASLAYLFVTSTGFTGQIGISGGKGKQLSSPNGGLSQDARKRSGKLERRVVADAAAGVEDRVAEQQMQSGKQAKKISIAGKSGNFESATSLFKELKDKDIPLTSLVYNCIIDASIQCDNLSAAGRFFNEAKAAGLADVVTYNTFMKGRLSKGDTEAVRLLLLDMAERGLQPTQIAYHCLLNALVQVGQPQQIWKTVEQMRFAGLSPNEVTCSILLKTLVFRSSEFDVERVITMVDEVVGQKDEILFASMVEALIRIQRLDLLKERTKLHSGGLPITSAPIYGSMIKAHGQARDIDSAWELWREMNGRGIVPTPVTLGVMVEALVSNQCVEDAWQLVQDMWKDQARKDAVNTVVYSTLLKGFAMSKQYDKVGQIYDEMRERKVPCNTITYNTMLNALARCGLVHRVPQILTDMQTAVPPVEPDTVTYSTIVKAYCLAGELDKAIALVKDMQTNGKCTPDEITFNSLLDGCARQRRLDDALRLLEEMRIVGITPSNFTLSIVVKLLGRARRLTQAFQMVDIFIQDHGVTPNIQVYTCLMQACFHNKQLAKALQLHDRIVAEHCKIDQKFYSALAKGCIHDGALVHAEDVVRCAYHLPGHKLSQTVGRRHGVDPACLQEVLDALGSRGHALAAEIPKNIGR